LDRKEYNNVVKEHAGNLYGFVFKYLRNEEDSHDIVQDVFEKLWVNRKKVDYLAAKSWMFRTGHNALINFSNRKQRTIYDATQIPENSVSEKGFEEKQMVEKVLMTLPPIQKSIVLLRDLEGYNYAEIGEILEISESQVKVYLFRARKKMQKQLIGLMLYK
jgi:RNA polymerase sigma factor (sigma-70 family)